MFAALPPSSSVSLFFVPATALGEQFADRCRTGERDLVDVGVIDQRLAGFARAGDDIDHAVRQLRFLKNFRQMHRGDAGRLGRFEHAGISRRERGREFPRRHQQRKIPGNDLPGHA